MNPPTIPNDPVSAVVDDYEYPDSDGQPIADDTLQFQYITTLRRRQLGLDSDAP